MHGLHAIVYVSSAVAPLSAEQTAHLLRRSRERNALAGVSGLLLYGDGCFMQYIEGPPDGLMPIYDIILADPLHRDIHELMSEPIAAREFEGWAMAYDQTTMPPFIKNPKLAHDALGQARSLLRTVWATRLGRG